MRALGRTIEGLYESEINVGVITDWDGGARVWLGAGAGPSAAERTFGRDEFDQIAGWLHAEAYKHFPDSQYATNAEASLQWQGVPVHGQNDQHIEPNDSRG